MSKIDKVVLTEFLRVGDLVEVQIEAEARGYGRDKDFPDGLQGVVVGFKTWENYVGRTQNWGGKPGKYYCADGAPLIRFPDGRGDYFSGHDLVFVDESLNQVRSNDRIDQDTLRVYAGPLPKSEFYEWDEVEFVGRFVGDFGTVRSIIFKDDEVEYYSVDLKGGGSSYAKDEDLKLVSRGNIWKHEHNEPLIFQDLKDECAFASATGGLIQIKNPLYPELPYQWSKEEVLTAIQEGRADCLKLEGGMFGSRKMDFAYRFTDRDLGERVRLETLKGFGLDPVEV